MIFIAKTLKGHNSVKILMELQFFFTTHCLFMLFICTKFHENILDRVKVIERTEFSYQNFQMGINP